MQIPLHFHIFWLQLVLSYFKNFILIIKNCPQPNYFVLGIQHQFRFLKRVILFMLLQLILDKVLFLVVQQVPFVK